MVGVDNEPLGIVKLADAFRMSEQQDVDLVEIAPQAADPRPAFWLEDVHRADFFGVTAPPQPNFSLHKVSDLRIHWSRAAKDTGCSGRNATRLSALC